MGKCLQSQERIMIPGTGSILAQPDVRIHFAKAGGPGATLSRSSRSREEEEEQEQARTSSLLLPALGRQPASALPPSSNVGRSPSSAIQLPSPRSSHKALPSPPHNMGFQVPLCHPHVIIHFFLPSCCLASLQTLTPAVSPGSPEDLHGNVHPGPAAVSLDSACLGMVCG